MMKILKSKRYKIKSKKVLVYMSSFIGIVTIILILITSNITNCYTNVCTKHLPNAAVRQFFHKKTFSEDKVTAENVAKLLETEESRLAPAESKAVIETFADTVNVIKGILIGLSGNSPMVYLLL